MLFNHGVLCHPLLLCSGIVPRMRSRSFFERGDGFCITCPEYGNFRLLAASRKSRFTPAFSNIHLFVLFSVHEAFRIQKREDRKPLADQQLTKTPDEWLPQSTSICQSCFVTSDVRLFYFFVSGLSLCCRSYLSLSAISCVSGRCCTAFLQAQTISVCFSGIFHTLCK